MKSSLVWTLCALAAVACALPAVEIDPRLGAAGSGGSGGTTAGQGGSAGAGNRGGSGPGSGGTAGNAGEGSGDTLEEACLDYCETFFSACGDFETNDYDDSVDCAVTCTTAGWPLGDSAEPNSVECRRHHAHLAAELGQDPHCFHSAEFPSKGNCEL